MPQNFYKSAAVTAKNFADLTRILEASGKKFVGRPATIRKVNEAGKEVFHHVPQEMSAEDTAKNMLFGHSGTGSFLVDIGKGILGGRVSKAIGNKYSKAQKHLSDWDIRAGHKIHETLKNDKGGFRDRISKHFLYTHDVPVAPSASGTADEAFKVDVPGVTAPFEKAKKVVLPFIGAMTVAGKVTDAQQKYREKKEKGGDVKVAEDLKRKELIEKISSILTGEDDDNKDTIKDKIDYTKVIKIASQASGMLKFAAQEHKRLLDENERLASENRKLLSEKKAKQQYERATKLASLMNEKGVIKKADIDAEVNKITNLEDDAYEILKTAMENISLNSKNPMDGVDNLTFLGSGLNIDSRGQKATLADSLEDAANGQ